MPLEITSLKNSSPITSGSLGSDQKEDNPVLSPLLCPKHSSKQQPIINKNYTRPQRERPWLWLRVFHLLSESLQTGHRLESTLKSWQHSHPGGPGGSPKVSEHWQGPWNSSAVSRAWSSPCAQTLVNLLLQQQWRCFITTVRYGPQDYAYTNCLQEGPSDWPAEAV